MIRGDFLHLQLKSPDGLAPLVVDMNVDENRISADPGLPMYPGRENDFVGSQAMRKEHLVAHKQRIGETDERFLRWCWKSANVLVG